jgi:ABC-type glycerol-3-phosphate transport system substrate-binding protein
MMLDRRTMLGAALAAGALPALAQQALPHGLRAGKPFNGTRLNVLAVVTPQFDGLALRTREFTDLTGIEVRWDFVPFAALQEKVSSVGVAADGSYDLVNYLDSWGPPNAHWLARLDPLLRRDGISMDRYPPAFAKAASFKGEVIGMPLRSHAQLFFYRRDVLAEVGATEAPKTWDEVVQVGKAIRAKRQDIEPLALYLHNDGNRQNLFIWLNFLWGAGGDVFDDRMRPAWTSEAALKATEDYVGLHTREKITNPGSISFVEQDARVSFQQGKSAMIPMWWWGYSPMIDPRQSVLTAEQVAFAGMPTYQGRTVTFAISMPFSISRHSRHQEAAWEFLKWVSNPDLDKRNATEREVGGRTIINNVVNHRSSLVDAEVNRANANIQQAAAASLANSDIMPQIPEWPQVGDLLSSAIARGAAGGNVRQLMTEASTRATAILRRAGYN